MKELIVSLTVLLAVATWMTEAKVFSRCGLANELVSKGIDKAQLSNWVCLVEATSSSNTALKKGPASDGSYEFGLFQINSKTWCKIGAKGGLCNVQCEKLLDDDITDDVACAKLIYKTQGFKAWNGWLTSCQSSLPEVGQCRLALWNRLRMLLAKTHEQKKRIEVSQ